MAAILAVVDDLFFVGKLTGTARQVGAALEVVRAADLDPASRSAPALLLVDLNAASADPVELIRRLKADPVWVAVPVVGFFSHVQVELERAARAAGCDEVLPRSRFVAGLADRLRRFV